MYQARVAGGNWTIATCGHPVRPGGRYLHVESSQDCFCAHCGILLLAEQLGSELKFVLDKLQSVIE